MGPKVSIFKSSWSIWSSKWYQKHVFRLISQPVNVYLNFLSRESDINQIQVDMIILNYVLLRKIYLYLNELIVEFFCILTDYSFFKLFRDIPN